MFFIPLLFSGILFNAFSPCTLRAHDAVSAPVESILPLLIYFNSDACTTCAEFDALFEKTEILQRMEKKYVPVKMSINDMEGRVCADIYDVTHIPAFVIADQKGVILYKSDETITIEEITRLLENIPSPFTEITPLKAIVVTEGSVPQKASDIVVDQPTVAVTETPNGSSDKVVRATLSHDDPKVVPVSNGHDPVPMQNLQMQQSPASEKNMVHTRAGSETKTTSEPQTDNRPVSSSKSSNSKSSHTQGAHTYAIQLGYFSEESNASKLVQKAVSKGFAETRSQTESRNGVNYFRVLIGKCPSLAEAQKLLDQVHSVGLKGAVYRQ